MAEVSAAEARQNFVDSTDSRLRSSASPATVAPHMATASNNSRPSPAPAAAPAAATKQVQIKLTVNLDEQSTLLVKSMQNETAKTNKFSFAPPPAFFVRQAVIAYAKSLGVKPVSRSAFLGEEETEE